MTAMTVAKFAKAATRFRAFLVHNNCEILEPTNEFEVLRFRSPAGVGIIYRNGHDRISNFSQIASQAWKAFKSDRDEALIFRPVKGTNKRARAARIAELKARDGSGCWYCGCPLTNDEATLEELLARSHGGPAVAANQVLACNSCNSEAGSRSVAEKVALRDRKRTAQRPTQETPDAG